VNLVVNEYEEMYCFGLEQQCIQLICHHITMMLNYLKEVRSLIALNTVKQHWVVFSGITRWRPLWPRCLGDLNMKHLSTIHSRR
jgi:hypothetical protein